ncbi:MAG: hypothetical protein L0Z62_26365 [Gemmataceae bacterium]|nr:hypothetical protein [Gemmataceae bacterium]
MVGHSLRTFRRFVVGAVLAYVVVVLTLGGTRHALTVFWGLAAVWLLALLLGSWRPPRLVARVLGALEPALSSVALTLLLAELSLRVYAVWVGGSLLLGGTLDDHRLRPGHDYGSGLRGNRLGYPGPDIVPTKPPGVYRVVALGDSFAVGPAVPFSENYLTRLQEALPGVEVCNFGVSAAGPRDYRAILQRDGWAVEPDLVLVSVFVGNDITESLAEPRALDPCGHALYQLCRRSWFLLRERARGTSPPAAGMPDRLARLPLSEEAFREVEARRLAACLTPPAPAMERKWRRALADLGGLLDDCRQRGVPVALVLIPDEFQVNPAVLEQALLDSGVTREAVDLDLPQRRLSTFCAGRGVPCLDLKVAFSGVPDTYAPRDTHWNVRGNRLAADRIAEWLRATYREAASGGR